MRTGHAKGVEVKLSAYAGRKSLQKGKNVA
jgi:hypothetical protein